MEGERESEGVREDKREVWGGESRNWAQCKRRERKNGRERV